MKKIISCALVMSTLASIGTMCFAGSGVNFTSVGSDVSQVCSVGGSSYLKSGINEDKLDKEIETLKKKVENLEGKQLDKRSFLGKVCDFIKGGIGLTWTCIKEGLNLVKTLEKIALLILPFVCAFKLYEFGKENFSEIADSVNELVKQLQEVLQQCKN